MRLCMFIVIVNKIGIEGALAIADVLPSTALDKLVLNSMLFSIDRMLFTWRIDANIGDEGAVAIAKQLPFTKIHKLYLDGTWYPKMWNPWSFLVVSVVVTWKGNSIERIGAEAIAKSLTSCPLRILSIERMLSPIRHTFTQTAQKSMWWNSDEKQETL